MTISSEPPVSPIDVWVVRKGKSGSFPTSGRTQPRKFIVEMIPTIESMKTIGFPASVRATKITPSATSLEAPSGQDAVADGPHHGADGDRADERLGGVAQDDAPASHDARRPHDERLRVVQGDEVVPHGHGRDGVELQDPERRRGVHQRLGGHRVDRRPVAAVDEQDRQAQSGERPHRALPPGRAVVGDHRDHSHRAALDRERHAHPDDPEEAKLANSSEPKIDEFRT